jgi:hypothetical protein
LAVRSRLTIAVRLEAFLIFFAIRNATPTAFHEVYRGLGPQYDTDDCTPELQMEVKPTAIEPYGKRDNLRMPDPGFPSIHVKAV